jgi:hypothetical protein
MTLNLENPPAGEKEATQKLTELLRKKMVSENPDRMMRDAHPKQHGLVKAEFIVEPDLPVELRVGIFKESRTYPAWIRFSNQNSPPLPDKDKDIRGMAIKLMGVEGKKLIEGKENEQTQDFLLISTDVFVTKDVVEFEKLINSLVSGRIKLIFFFLTHLRVAFNLLTSNKRFASPLEARYWSTTPYLFGSKAVKYSAKPSSSLKSKVPKNPSDNYLREAMAERLAACEVTFDFMIQFQKNTRTMPIEDPGKRWSQKDSPFIKAATIKIPVQEFDSPEQIEFGDNLSFTPWHSLPEHRPLGGINRARKIVYEALSEFRHQCNNVPQKEPAGFELF